MVILIKRLSLFVSLSLLVLIAIFIGNSLRAEVFNPQSFTLSNGLQVVLVPNNRAPIVTLIVYYQVGAMDEPPGKSGLAHFLEHLMFKGRTKLGPGRYSTLVARIGGRSNAFTSQDYTGYITTFAAEHIDLILQLEAARMMGLELALEDIETERNVVLEERLSRVDKSPQQQLSEQAAAALYANHPYRNPIVGWEHEIKTLTHADLMSFYRTWYVPNNSVIVISGGTTIDKIKPIIERYFGILPAHKLPKRTNLIEPPKNTERIIKLSHSRVAQPSWSRRYLAPSHGVGDKTQIFALEVLAEILSGGNSGRLYRRLVVEQAVAIHAGAWYSPSKRGPGLFGFYGTPRPGRSLDEIETAIGSEISELLKYGVTDKEVHDAINRLRADAVFARDSLSSPPRIIGNALMNGQTLIEIETWPDRINGVTKAMITSSARKVFKVGGGITTRLTPIRQVENKM